MKALTIETSTELECVGLVVDNELVSERSVEAGRGRDLELLEVVREVLAGAGMRPGDLDLVAVSSGPGRFTGLRVGMATAKGLAAPGGPDVVAVSTLRALAASSGLAGTVAPLLDARRGEVYAALFEGGRRLSDDIACAPGELGRALPKVDGAIACVGGGALAYRDAVADALGTSAVIVEEAPVRPDPGALARLAETAPPTALADIEPIYVRGVGAVKPVPPRDSG
ncbi:MAG: tRNA (adenosine(37)-N6)-threonylcarbamoyltransferase complex dimerization subunit type 1 TsaB [Candidatus Eisenbacteria bacterium]|nr:tRNA (adenosine(37)-N6)-threonylcarbamoyltransferase complex dimerization subunit type 1 TsaB [Candidatus Eisenbacteria bacterium]